MKLSYCLQPIRLNKFIFGLIIELFVAGILNLSAQTPISLKLKENSWDLKGHSTFKFVVPLKENINHLDSPIILNNKDTVTRYVYKRFYFTKQKIPARNYLAILIGTNSNYTPLLVVDKNFNNSFSDDSVYLFSFPHVSENEEALYESLPVISIDSLDIDSSNKKRSLSFKIAPYFKGSKFLNDKSAIKSAKKYFLSFYATDYLSSYFVINKQLFEFAIIPHPLSFPIYKETNVAQGRSRWSYVISKINRSGNRQKYIDWGPYQKIVDELKDSSKAIHILNKYLLVNSISLDSNSMSVSILDSAVYAKSQNKESKQLTSLKKFEAFCLNEGKFLNYDFRKNKLTLLEFSGSWCVPCTQVLPQLKELYKKYSDNVEFVSLMEEKSKADAEKFFANHNLQWPVFYENISDSVTVKAKMKVKIYPNFILINQQGEIIYQQYSSQSLDKIEAQIQKYFAGS